jgi:hypothetical protein
MTDESNNDTNHRLARELVCLLLYKRGMITGTGIGDKVENVGKGSGFSGKPMTSMEVVCSCMEVVEKLCVDVSGLEKARIAVALLETVVAGKDGLLGTDDDIFSPEVIHGIKSLISTGGLEDIMHFICQAAKGKLNLQITGCWRSMFRVLRRR